MTDSKSTKSHKPASQKIKKRKQGIVKKIPCLLGIHSWKWKYIKPNSCQQNGICNRCGKNKKRIKHNWGDWEYKESDSCFTERVCQRCNLQEDGDEEHDWGDWEYESSDSCLTIRSCQRCNEIESGVEEHRWGEWRYESPTSCALIRFCRRCDESDYDYDGGHQYNKKGVCKRCGERSEQQ